MGFTLADAREPQARAAIRKRGLAEEALRARHTKQNKGTALGRSWLKVRMTVADRAFSVINGDNNSMIRVEPGLTVTNIILISALRGAAREGTCWLFNEVLSHTIYQVVRPRNADHSAS
eukprot:750381-Rhodomonas_salina.3